ncbi:hypothetical protein FB107DRAFT_261329, partial [Schizophyllum commune]
MRAWSIASIIAARAGSAVKLASESAEGGILEPAEGRAQRPRFREAESRLRLSNKPRCVSTAFPGSQQTRGVFKGRLYGLASPDDKS